MKNLIIILSLTFLSCATNYKQERFPSSSEIVITKNELKNLSPIEIINILKENSAKNINVFFENLDEVNWNQSQIDELKSLEEDHSPIMPVVKTTSNIYCFDQSHLSSVSREVQHIKLALKKGYYPVSQCSTYDLIF